MFFVECNDNVKIAVNEMNSNGKKTIVFVHGLIFNHQIFEYQYNYLIDKNYRIISIDLRGFGYSDKPISGYNYFEMAKDLEQVISKLNLYDITLIGFSLGASVCIKYISKYGTDRVSKLILVSATAPSFTNFHSYPYGASKSEINRLIDLGYNNRPELVKQLIDISFSIPKSIDFTNWLKSLALNNSSYATIKILEMLRDENLMNDLESINLDTVICYGSNDLICDPNFGKILNDNIKNSKLYYFEKSGHILFLDEIEKFNKLLLDFINSN